MRVESLFAVERYPTLWQMTSTVTGELRSDVGCYEYFVRFFPAGRSPAPRRFAPCNCSARLRGSRAVSTQAQ